MRPVSPSFTTLFENMPMYLTVRPARQTDFYPTAGARQLTDRNLGGRLPNARGKTPNLEIWPHGRPYNFTKQRVSFGFNMVGHHQAEGIAQITRIGFSNLGPELFGFWALP